MNLNTIFAEVKKFPRTFWLLILGTFLNQAGNMAFVFLMPYLSLHLGYSIIQASFIFALFGLMTMISNILVGSIIDYYGAARVLLAALFFNCIILLCFPLVKHYVSIMIMTIIWGLNYGFFRPAVKTLVSFMTPIELHRISFSIYRWSVNLGMSIGPALGGFITVYSYAGLFMANALSNILAFTVFTLSLIKTSWYTYRPSKDSKIELSLKWLFRDKKLALIVLGFIPIDIVFFQHESTLSIFLTQNLHFPLSFYGLLFTLNTLLIVFFELPLNFAMLGWTARHNLMLGALLIASGFAGLYWATTQWHVILLTVLWSFGEMIAFPSANAYVAQIAPLANRGSYMSLFEASANLGLCLGPTFGSFIMYYSSAHGLWITCGILGLISIFIFNFTREHTDGKQHL